MLSTGWQACSRNFRPCWLIAVALAGTSSAVPADDVLDPLLARINAAQLIVEGDAGRGYAAWDGSDPRSIRTFTPLVVVRVMKGSLHEDRILLRQPGGAIGGATRVEPLAAQFEPSERVIVFVGSRDATDGSFDIYGGSLGTYHVVADADGVPAVAVRLGVDASVYSSKEKAPGTLLAQVTLERFARFAAGSRPQMERARDASRARSIEAPRIAAQPPAAEGHRSPGRSAVIVLTVLTALSLVTWRLVRRRSSSW